MGAREGELSVGRRKRMWGRPCLGCPVGSGATCEDVDAGGRWREEGVDAGGGRGRAWMQEEVEGGGHGCKRRKIEGRWRRCVWNRRRWWRLDQNT